MAPTIMTFGAASARAFGFAIGKSATVPNAPTIGTATVTEIGRAHV